MPYRSWWHAINIHSLYGSTRSQRERRNLRTQPSCQSATGTPCDMGQPLFGALGLTLSRRSANWPRMATSEYVPKGGDGTALYVKIWAPPWESTCHGDEPMEPSEPIALGSVCMELPTWTPEGAATRPRARRRDVAKGDPDRFEYTAGCSAGDATPSGTSRGSRARTGRRREEIEIIRAMGLWKSCAQVPRCTSRRHSLCRRP